ncbi:MAG: lipid A export permease/ATP-binding protein MsbA [Gammaproteobacteria bacterium]
MALPGAELQAGVVYRRLIRYAVPYWPVFLLAIAGMILYAATETGFAYLIKPLLDQGFVQRDAQVIRWMPFAILLVFALRSIGSFLSDYYMSRVGRSVIKNLRRDVFGHFLILPTAYYDRSTSGALLSKLTFNIEQVAQSTTTVITTVIRDALTVAGLLTYMFIQSVFLSLFVIVTGPLIGALVRFVSTKFRRYSARIQSSMGDVTQAAEEAIEGHRVIKVFSGEAQEREAFERVNERNRHLNMRLVATKAGSSGVVQMIAAIGMASVVYVATLGPMLDTITVGTFSSFIGAMLLLMPPLKRLTDINAPLQQGIAAGQSIFELLDEAPEQDTGTEPLERARGDVEFRHVQFAYAAAKGTVLKDIELRVPAGQTLAIVGRSGSGKSTLISLLPRFYAPESGEILIDGRSIDEYRLRDLRNQISLVSQDVVLFNDTIGNNIAYGSLGVVSREDIEAAARAAHVPEFADVLPEGLETMVGDRGVLLSGGQRQRIAIARALLKDAPILILDEATSALDTESERHIQQALDQLMRNRTTLVIAHRLSTVERADRIIVLDEGRIVERGTHAELLELSGLYAALYRMQFEA